jgi:hypothetical protein
MEISKGIFSSNPSTIVVPATGRTAIVAALEFGVQLISDAKSQAILIEAKGQSLAPSISC